MASTSSSTRGIRGLRDLMLEPEDQNAEPEESIWSLILQLEIMKLVLTLPLVQETFQGLYKLSEPLQPYFQSIVTKLSPIMVSGLTTIKESLDEKMPDSVKTKAIGVVRWVDLSLFTGLGALVENISVLKESTSSLYATTKTTAARCCHDVSSYLASFTLSQLALRIGDSSLEILGTLVQVFSESKENYLTNSLIKVRKGLHWISQEGAEKIGIDKMKVLKEAPLMEAMAHVFNWDLLLSFVGASKDDKNESMDDLVVVSKMASTR